MSLILYSMSFIKRLFRKNERKESKSIDYSLVSEALQSKDGKSRELLVSKASGVEEALILAVETVRSNPETAPKVFRELSKALSDFVPAQILGPLQHGILPQYFEQRLDLEVIEVNSDAYKLEYLDELDCDDGEFSIPEGARGHPSFYKPGASLSPGFVSAQNVTALADNRNVVIESIEHSGVIREISVGNLALLQGQGSKVLKKIDCKGRSVLLAGLTIQPNYYHWMFDVIVRLGVVKRAGVTWQRILMNPMKFTPMHEDLLECVGIDVEEIEFVEPGTQYVFEELVVPLTIADLGNAKKVRRVDGSKPRNGVRPWRIPRWSAQLIRSKVFGSSRYQELEGSAPDNIFIGRRGSRSLINQEQVETLLETHNYQVVYLEDYTFLEQAALLSTVKSVIALHGAGLANLVFCSPSTRVLEIFNVDYVNPCYFHLATQLDLDYECLIVGDRDKNSVNLLDPQKSNDGISLDIDDLRNYLSRK